MAGFGAGFRQKNGELVAPDAGNKVGGTQIAIDHLCYPHQQYVSNLVAEAVVDDLEIINVHVGQGERMLVAADPVLLPVGHLAKGAQIRNPSEEIYARKFLLLAIGCLQPRENDCRYQKKAKQDDGVPIADNQVPIAVGSRVQQHVRVQPGCRRNCRSRNSGPRAHIPAQERHRQQIHDREGNLSVDGARQINR